MIFMRLREAAVHRSREAPARGADPDVFLTRKESFYDREQLTEFINSPAVTVRIKSPQKLRIICRRRDGLKLSEIDL